MKSFGAWMKENNPGNYVSVNVSGLPLNLVASIPGQSSPEPHITLMYSKESNVPLDHIDYVMRRKKLIGSVVPISGVDVFDTPADDSGNREESLGCIVMTVNSSILNDTHDQLVRLGCKHSYTPFQAHATLIYNCPIYQCRMTAAEIQKRLDSGEEYPLTITSYNNTRVIEDWVDSRK